MQGSLFVVIVREGGARRAKRLAGFNDGIDLRCAKVEKREPLRAIIQLVDIRHGPTELDLMMIDWLKEMQRTFLLVFTKADKLSQSKQKQLFDRLESEGTLAGISFVPFSALNGQGRQDVLGWIENVLEEPTDL